MFQRVLMIDDDPAIHKVAEVHLCNWRTELLSAFDGKSGLAAAAGQNPDLIMLDVDMPGLGGLEVCRRLKADPVTRGIPILFLTAAASTNEKLAGFELGATDYLTKPFDPSELCARVRAALRTQYLLGLLASKAMVDDLTGLYNRVYFERQFPIELAKAQRAKSPLGCLILGIDRFREIVQQHGYAAAEEVLSHAAASLGRTCPTEHVVCRYAEEQFGVLAFDSDVPRAVELAERLREGVKASPASYENTPLDVTVSVGLSVSRLSCDEGVAFEAEEALSRARHGGGDCVMVGGRWVELRLANQSTKRCQCN